MAEVILSESNLLAWQWWEDRRLRFNIGLIIAGLLAFILYQFVYYTCGNRLPMEFDVTIFSILFLGIGYLFYIFLANIFYFWGVLSEKLLRIKNLKLQRKLTYTLGFLLAISIPFLEPLSLAYFAIFDPVVSKYTFLRQKEYKWELESTGLWSEIAHQQLKV